MIEKKLKTKKTWLMFAGVANVKIYSHHDNQYKLIVELDYPRGRSLSNELVSDRHGEHQRDKDRYFFAKQVASFMEFHLKNNHYSHIILYAEPCFLGILRKSLSHNVKATITRNIQRNYMPTIVQSPTEKYFSSKKYTH